MNLIEALSINGRVKLRENQYGIVDLAYDGAGFAWKQKQFAQAVPRDSRYKNGFKKVEITLDMLQSTKWEAFKGYIGRKDVDADY